MQPWPDKASLGLELLGTPGGAATPWFILSPPSIQAGAGGGDSQYLSHGGRVWWGGGRGEEEAELLRVQKPMEAEMS